MVWFRFMVVNVTFNTILVIGSGNLSTRRKQPASRKSLTKLVGYLTATLEIEGLHDRCMLWIIRKLLFPSSIKSWNKLSPQLRNAPTLNRFKQATKNQTIKPPKFYNVGCRMLNIIHTRQRHKSSILNADLFRVHFTNGSGCICGCAFEDESFYIRMLSLQRSKWRIEI